MINPIKVIVEIFIKIRNKSKVVYLSDKDVSLMIMRRNIDHSKQLQLKKQQLLLNYYLLKMREIRYLINTWNV